LKTNDKNDSLLYLNDDKNMKEDEMLSK